MSQPAGAPRTRGRRWAGALVLLLLGAMSARADDATTPPPPREPDLQERIDAHEDLVVLHRRDGPLSALTEDMKVALELYRATPAGEPGDDARERIVKTVGLVVRKERDDGVRKAGIEVLGAMQHEDCAKWLKPFLKAPKDDKIDPLLLPAIAAAGGVAQDCLVTPLLRIVEDSKNYMVAARAVEALGKFRRASESSHARILLGLTKTIVKDLPSSPSRGKENESTGDYIPGKSGDSGTARWGALAPAITKALNELTGQKIYLVQDWMNVVKQNRRNLKALFRERDED